MQVPDIEPPGIKHHASSACKTAKSSDRGHANFPRPSAPSRGDPNLPSFTRFPKLSIEKFLVIRPLRHLTGCAISRPPQRRYKRVSQLGKWKASEPQQCCHISPIPRKATPNFLVFCKALGSPSRDVAASNLCGTLAAQPAT